MVAAREALARLREGNRRYVSGVQDLEALSSAERRSRLVERQDPVAAILGCSDSRVPVELVFDQGLGDLFVVRVAGNVAAPSQIGSIEFATKALGARLVVVLGHSGCGAVKATVEELQRSNQSLSENLRTIVRCIQPAVEGLLETDLVRDEGALLGRAVRENVHVTSRTLRESSAIIGQLMETDGLVVVGAEYSLETGEVDFFDGVPDGW